MTQEIKSTWVGASPVQQGEKKSKLERDFARAQEQLLEANSKLQQLEALLHDKDTELKALEVTLALNVAASAMAESEAAVHSTELSKQISQLEDALEDALARATPEGKEALVEQAVELSARYAKKYVILSNRVSLATLRGDSSRKLEKARKELNQEYAEAIRKLFL